MKCTYGKHTVKGRFKIIFLLMIITMVHAQAMAASVRISWNANTESNLRGYNVYYGTMSHVYSKSIDAGNFTSVDIDGLKAGKTYYVAVTAYNAAGESDFSDENSIAIPEDANVAQAMDGDGGSGGSGSGCFISVCGW